MSNELWDLTNDEVLKKWNKGEIVWTIEMGGIGPGYEQALQNALFSLFDYLHKKKIRIKDIVTDHKYNKKFDNLEMKVFKGMRLSGAQAETARGVAFQFHKYGYAHMMRKAKEQIPDRFIQVKNTIKEVKQ